MPDVILWNSIAKRRRSPSDTFLENGMGVLKSSLESKGFEVEIVDWAQNDWWQKITPGYLGKINRFLASFIIPERKTNSRIRKLASKLVAPFFLLCQSVTTAVQNRRFNNMLLEFTEYIKKSECQVLGIKIWYGDAYTGAKTLVELVKALAPNILIVAGGPHVSIYREKILKDSDFDIAVTGAGEDALAGILSLLPRSSSKKDLLRKISQNAAQGKLKNIIYRKGKSFSISERAEAEANATAIPVYDSFQGKTKIHVIVDSLGCPWGKCSFCVHSQIYPTYSCRDPKLVVDEIALMVSKGIGIFRFAGSSSSLQHVKGIAEQIEQRGLKIIYSMFARSEKGVSEKHIYSEVVSAYRKLIQSGLRAVFVGVEAADDAILNTIMCKGLELKDIEATIQAIREASKIEQIPIDIGLSFIYPSPTHGLTSLENLLKANVSLVEKTSPDSVLVNPPAPFPNSSWYNNAYKYGFKLGSSFALDMLSYDYVLYKPPSMWPAIEFSLDGMGMQQIFEETGRFGKLLSEKGYVTDVTDEHFLMLRAAGYKGSEGVKAFKRESMLDIISSEYAFIRNMEEIVNKKSETLAKGNM